MPTNQPVMSSAAYRALAAPGAVVRKNRTPRSCPTEHQEQVAFIQLCKAHEAQYPALEWIFAVPNGGARSKATGALLKAEGVRAGVPDIFLPVGVGGYHGFVAELKPLKDGALTPGQIVWLLELRRNNWYSGWYRGADEMLAGVLWYVSGGATTEPVIREIKAEEICKR